MNTAVRGRIAPDCGGVVLCGGASRRMGRPKLSLPVGEELMLPRVVRLLQEVVSPVVVVAGPHQEVPALPADVRIVRDEYEHLGPLAGLAAGLEALQGESPTAYVSSCDVPLLKPAFVRAVIARLGRRELAVPRDGRFHHPLAAVYQTALAARARALVDADRLRPLFLIEESDADEFDVDELRSVDPDLDSLRNVNTPEDYADVLRRLSAS